MPCRTLSKFESDIKFVRELKKTDFAEIRGRNSPWPDDSLPIISDASVNNLRLQGTLAKRLPAMPASAMGDLSFTDARAREIQEEMYAMSVAAAERKFYEKRSKKIAKAKNRAYGRIAERKTKLR